MKKHWESIKHRAKEVKAKITATKVYSDLLQVEKAINDTGTVPWVGAGQPSPWQTMVANIISYDVFHSNKHEKTFGKKYLDKALEQYDQVYRHYTLSSEAPQKLQKSLDVLLASINQEIQKCNQKLENNKIS